MKRWGKGGRVPVFSAYGMLVKLVAVQDLGNLCLNYCSASKIFPSHAALSQHQRPRFDSRQQMFGKQPQRFPAYFSVPDCTDCVCPRLRPTRSVNSSHRANASKFLPLLKKKNTFRKNRKISANVLSASPVNTRTAERTFAQSRF